MQFKAHRLRPSAAVPSIGYNVREGNKRPALLLDTGGSLGELLGVFYGRQPGLVFRRPPQAGFLRTETALAPCPLFQPGLRLRQQRKLIDESFAGAPTIQLAAQCRAGIGAGIRRRRWYADVGDDRLAGSLPAIVTEREPAFG